MANLSSHTFARAVGKLTAVEAKLKGLRGVFKTLAEQHSELTLLLARVEDATSRAERHDAWLELRSRLLAHDQAKSSELYSTLQHTQLTAQLARRHATASLKLRAELDRLDALPSSSDEWKDRLRDFREYLLQSFSDEEQHRFVRAQQVIGEGSAEELRAPYLLAYERALAALGANGD